MELFGFSEKTVEYDQAQTVICKTIPFAANIKWDLKNFQNAEVTLTANATMDAPINWKKGRLVMLDVIQGGAGGFTLAWAAPFKSISSLVLTSTAGASNVLVFKCIDGGFVSLVSNSTMTRA